MSNMYTYNQYLGNFPIQQSYVGLPLSANVNLPMSVPTQQTAIAPVGTGSNPFIQAFSDASPLSPANSGANVLAYSPHLVERLGDNTGSSPSIYAGTNVNPPSISQTTTPVAAPVSATPTTTSSSVVDQLAKMYDTIWSSMFGVTNTAPTTSPSSISNLPINNPNTGFGNPLTTVHINDPSLGNVYITDPTLPNAANQDLSVVEVGGYPAAQPTPNKTIQPVKPTGNVLNMYSL